MHGYYERIDQNHWNILMGWIQKPFITPNEFVQTILLLVVTVKEQIGLTKIVFLL